VRAQVVAKYKKLKKLAFGFQGNIGRNLIKFGKNSPNNYKQNGVGNFEI